MLSSASGRRDVTRSKSEFEHVLGAATYARVPSAAMRLRVLESMANAWRAQQVESPTFTAANPASWLHKWQSSFRMRPAKPASWASPCTSAARVVFSNHHVSRAASSYNFSSHPTTMPSSSVIRSANLFFPVGWYFHICLRAPRRRPHPPTRPRGCGSLAAEAADTESRGRASPRRPGTHPWPRACRAAMTTVTPSLRATVVGSGSTQAVTLSHHVCRLSSRWENAECPRAFGSCCC
jgi:hypothetical protein